MAYKRGFNEIHFYMNQVTSHLVAKTGIPSDKYHLGKVILHSLQSDPDFILQIDGATGQTETFGSVLNKSVKCAVSLKKLGLQKDDVMVLMGPNHIDLCIPHYAGLYLGVAIAAVDETLGVDELKDIFNMIKPKIIFGQSAKAITIENAVTNANLHSKIVTFQESSKHTSLGELLKNTDDEEVTSFKPSDFNPVETIAYLTSTSGTTGTPKTAMLTHENLSVAIPYLWQICSKFPTPTRLALVVSPLQWLTAGMQFLFTPILKVPRLQTSAVITPEHFGHLINTYKPTFTIVSPTLLKHLLSAKDQCDLSCLDYLLMGGSAVTQELIDEVKILIKSDEVYGMYGMSELSGMAFQHHYPPRNGSSGSTIGALEYRLVDLSTNEDITEANVAGELWLRGRQVFKGYYNNPEDTAEALTKDGWVKTGDIFYRDDSYQFYFVERFKSLLKYRNHQIAPAELEMVIRKHPGVQDVCVTGIPDKEVGDLVVACVIRKPGYNPSAQEIKDVVKESLTDTKQIRGGVIFLEKFPTTNSGKIHRKKIKDLVLTLERE